MVKQYYIKHPDQRWSNLIWFNTEEGELPPPPENCVWVEGTPTTEPWEETTPEKIQKIIRDLYLALPFDSRRKYKEALDKGKDDLERGDFAMVSYILSNAPEATEPEEVQFISTVNSMLQGLI